MNGISKTFLMGRPEGTQLQRYVNKITVISKAQWKEGSSKPLLNHRAKNEPED